MSGGEASPCDCRREVSLEIAKIETWLCDVPIANPINLGNFTVLKRSYLAVRVHSADGLTADSVIQSRGAPLDAVIAEILAPRLLGRDARDTASLKAMLELELTALETHGAIGRAWSAVEICLQGLRAKACGWPLWRMLGGAPRPVPVLMVEGYAIQGEGDDAFVDRLVARVEEGYSLLKIEAGHYAQGAHLVAQLEQFRKAVGGAPQIVLDMAWSWTEAKSKAHTTRALEDLGIAWIEDPFSSSAVRQYRELRRDTITPIGGGDETSRPENMYALLEADALDVLRLDATTMGGIDSVRALTIDAARRGVRVSYHVHPEIHEHLVFGLGVADHVEMFPTDRQFDRIHDFTLAPSFDRVVRGRLAPSETPGTGLELDVDRTAAFARRHLSSSREAHA